MHNRFTALQHRVERLETKLDEVLRLLQTPKSGRAEYQRQYYLRRKAEKETGRMCGRMRNLDGSCMTKRDTRVPVEVWAKHAERFRERPVWFLEWLCWHWNTQIYHVNPLTRSGNMWRVFIGWRADSKPMRHGYGEKDLWGKRVLSKTFGEALWWHFGRCVLGELIDHLQEGTAWSQLPADFRKLLEVNCGGFQSHKLRNGKVFDHLEGLDELQKTYKWVQPWLMRGHLAAKKGLLSSVEPYPEFRPI